MPLHPLTDWHDHRIVNVKSTDLLAACRAQGILRDEVAVRPQHTFRKSDDRLTVEHVFKDGIRLKKS